MASIFDQLAALFKPGPALASITAPELQQQLKGKAKPLVLDVRTPGETALGVIGGARLIPLDALAQRATELPKNQPIVCVCRSGRRSATACKQLAALGFPGSGRSPDRARRDMPSARARLRPCPP